MHVCTFSSSTPTSARKNTDVQVSLFGYLKFCGAGPLCLCEYDEGPFSLLRSKCVWLANWRTFCWTGKRSQSDLAEASGPLGLWCLVMEVNAAAKNLLGVRLVFPRPPHVTGVTWRMSPRKYFPFVLQKEFSDFRRTRFSFCFTKGIFRFSPD